MKVLEKQEERLTEKEEAELLYRTPMVVDEIMEFEPKTRIGTLPI